MKMPKADKDLKLYGKCAYLFVDDPESIKAAEEAMRKNALEFLEKENILQIITHTQEECSPDGFPIIPDGPEIKAAVAWKLDMNPLLKEPPEGESE